MTKRELINIIENLLKRYPDDTKILFKTDGDIFDINDTRYSVDTAEDKETIELELRYRRKNDK